MSLSSNTVTLTSGGSATWTLNIRALHETSLGTYTITVTPQVAPHPTPRQSSSRSRPDRPIFTGQTDRLTGNNQNLSSVAAQTLKPRGSIQVLNRPTTTRIGVKRIVIEVNRDLTVEQLEILDNALKQVGLVQTTKVTFHRGTVHKPRLVRPPHPTFHFGAQSSSASSR